MTASARRSGARSAGSATAPRVVTRRSAAVSTRSASATATAVPGPAGTATEASGSAAISSTHRRSAVALAYAAWASGHAALSLSAPIAAVAAPNARIGTKSGTATRFATGDTSEMRPKTAATIGMVGADAAIVAARPSRTGAGSADRLAASGRSHATSPAVAATLRMKPTSSTANGSMTSIARTAAASAFAASPRRPMARARAPTLAMSAARPTLGAGPTSRLYIATAATVVVATASAGTRPRRPNATAVATSVMLKPEIARRCVVPVAANASRRSRPMLVRSPSTIPRRIPLSGSGTSAKSAVASGSRMRTASATAGPRSSGGVGRSVRAASPAALAATAVQRRRRGASALARARIAPPHAAATPNATASSGRSIATCARIAARHAAAASGARSATVNAS